MTLAIPLSVLDLSPIKQGGDARAALQESLALARHVEALGYRRYWMAEHHNMPGIASAATAVAIAHVAGGTHRIRVGAGGIMLPNHAPLVVAEQFGTLAALFGDRIDLGVGRAPGTDPRTAMALRRAGNAESFPQDVQALLAYLDDPAPDQPVRAIPGAGTKVPVWILGSSHFGAQLAAVLGLPYAFASHFAPDDLSFAVQLYRQQFRPSRWLDKPYVMLGLNACLADTDADARLLFTSVQQAVVNLRSGQPGPLPPPLPGYEDGLEPHQAAMVGHVLRCAIVGGANSAAAALSDFIATHRPDELMVTSQIFDAAARRKSYEILAHIHAPGG
ncbi:MAG TPA: LLM class flavin-dependent oxidoreductase [Rhizomicrobium sp.]|nr:LLM class flavin-dependent oxidoreductase [Rhizomicrobium sp.]